MALVVKIRFRGSEVDLNSTWSMRGWPGHQQLWYLHSSSGIVWFRQQKILTGGSLWMYFPIFRRGISKSLWGTGSRAELPNVIIDGLHWPEVRRWRIGWVLIAFNWFGHKLAPLTHWGRDKMDAISQTTFSSAFSCMGIFEFRLKFHWSLFLRVHLEIFQHWLR